MPTPVRPIVRTFVRSWVDPYGGEHTAAGVLRQQGLRHPDDQGRLAPPVERPTNRLSQFEQRRLSSTLPVNDITGTFPSTR